MLRDTATALLATGLSTTASRGASMSSMSKQRPMHKRPPMSKRPSDGAIPALVHAYVECPHCGRIPKPTGTILTIPGGDAMDRVHCRIPCERCGYTGAMLYLERELMPRH